MIHSDRKSHQHTFAGGLNQNRPALVKPATMLAVIICLLVTMFVVKAGSGTADDIRRVCWSSVWVRDEPANRPIRLLRQGEKFKLIKISKHGEDWAYGYAFGGENAKGWVQLRALTCANGKCCH
jgi:hypothetical protein